MFIFIFHKGSIKLIFKYTYTMLNFRTINIYIDHFRKTCTFNNPYHFMIHELNNFLVNVFIKMAKD